MLQEQKITYENLLNPNADLASQHFRVEHFLPACSEQDTCPWRTTDRITVYQHSDSEQACAIGSTAGACPPPFPGTQIQPEKTFVVETYWSNDGVPTKCSLIKTDTTSSMQRVGKCLTAMPLGINRSAGYQVSVTQEVPVVYRTSP